MFINTTESIGTIIQAGTQSVTGSLFLTLLMIFIFLVIIGIIFSIPLEFISIILLPFCLACASHYGNFVAPVAIILIYVSTIITKNWIFR